MLRAVLILACGLFLAAPRPLQAQLPAEGLFARTNLVAWCIVPFDSRKRTPEERAAMLEQLGIRRLAYDWRAEHIPTFDAEVAALRKHGIELTAWWFPAGLNDEANAILACLERNRLSPQLWITLGTEPEPNPARLAEKIDQTVATLAPLCTAAQRLGSTVGLYNHLGWFGEPTNQVKILQRLRAAGHTNVGAVYNFHHGHAHIDTWPQQLDHLKPYLLAVNLNGMVWDGDQLGKKIIPLGSGDEELRMLQVLQASGWKGPVGILGHTDEDAELKLRKELAGLERLAPLSTQAPKPAPQRPPRRSPPPAPAATPPHLPAAGSAVVASDAGTVLDARVSGALVDGQPAFRRRPLRIETRARLDRPDAWNILVASEAKSSPTHWELYTFAGTGDLSFYAPGMSPDTVRSGVSVCDGQWHTLVAHVTANEVTLEIDGREVARQAVEWRFESDDQPAQLAVGRLVEGGLGCDGFIATVRMQRPGDQAGTAVIAPWATLTAGDPEAVRRLTTGLATRAVAGNRSVSKPGPARAPGEPAVSGREPGSQGEKDWVDNRWQQTDIGPFLASTLHLPGGVVKRALTVKVGTETNGAVTYDMETGAIRAAWTGGFLTFDPTRFGLIGAIRPEGTLAFEGLGPRKDAPGEFRWTGIHNGAHGPVLEYQLNGVRILEAPGFLRSPVGPVFVRSFRVGPRRESLSLLIAGHTRGTKVGNHVIHNQHTTEKLPRAPGGGTTQQTWSGLFVHNDDGDTRSAAAVVGLPTFSTQSHVSNDGGREELTLPAGDAPLEMTVYLWRGLVREGEAFQKFIQTVPPAERSPEALAQAGPARWTPLTTRGQRGADTDFLAIDTLTVPYDNPFKALLFGSGVDVDPEGAVYFSTMHGDVWKITGVDAGLQKLRWQRFATGLYQPLGLKVKAGQVYVLGRDRITRLHDTNRDGEADFYENFFDGIATSAGGHDYVTCLEVDDAGRFYYVDPVGLHRVEADGRRSETLATGFRNPNGMGVRPDGRVITAAPQQGTWTPSSFIAEIRPGGYYGYGGPRPDPSRPLGYDAPLCWIPHGVDNSSGSQVWVPSGQWGPLGGQMLHLLWGRCGLMLVLRDSEGAESPARQGAVVPLPGKLLSGPNRGSFDPRDGSLYIAGSTGWQTSAVKDGALQRVRFTGKRAALPVRFHVRPGGLEVRFSVPVDRATAEDPGSYALKRWNYRYAEAYGSKDWSVAAPDREGRDDVSIRAATLAADGRTVFLEIPDLKPVMQMELKYNVDAADGGKPLRGQLWLTVNEPRPER